MWKILSFYGFPNQLIEVIKNSYENLDGAVNRNGNLSDWFKVMSGVRQGCLLSPLLEYCLLE